MINRIEEIKHIREEKKRLARRELVLTSPLLDDFKLIDHMYIWYKEILKERNCAPQPESVNQRKKFILIVLLLYSPTTLAGGKMTVGLRDKLADVLNIYSRTTISDNCSDIVFLYNRYKSFKTEAEYAYNRIIQRLKSIGIEISIDN